MVPLAYIILHFIYERLLPFKILTTLQPDYFWPFKIRASPDFGLPLYVTKQLKVLIWITDTKIVTRKKSVIQILSVFGSIAGNHWSCHYSKRTWNLFFFFNLFNFVGGLISTTVLQPASAFLPLLPKTSIQVGSCSTNRTPEIWETR